MLPDSQPVVINAVVDGDESVRQPLSRSLPIWLRGSAQPQPCPGHKPSWAIGVLRRVATKPPPLNRMFRRQLRHFVRSFCHHVLEPIRPDTDLSVEHWLTNVDYTLSRKASLLKTYRSNLAARVSKKYTQVDGFVKNESYDEVKAPRLIHSRHDFFKAFSGPLFKAISDGLFKVTDKNSWFIKNVPVSDRPQVICDKLFELGAEYISTDYTSYESHFTKEIMSNIEFGLYDFMVKHLSQEEKAKMAFIKEVISGKNRCKYSHGGVTISATRMSGEMNTSLGNGFTNLILTLFLVYRKFVEKTGIKSVPMFLSRELVKGFVEGDDGLFVFKPGYRPTPEDYASVGFTIKVAVTRDLNKASFCGNVFDIVDKVVLTDPIEVLENFGWTKKKYVRAGYSVRMQLLRSRALSMCHQYNGVPIVSALGRRIEFLTRGYSIRDSIIWSEDAYHREKLRTYCNSPLPVERVVTSGTRQLVSELWDVSVESQLSIERSIAHVELDCALMLTGFSFKPIHVMYYEQYSAAVPDLNFVSNLLNCDDSKVWSQLMNRTYAPRLVYRRTETFRPP